jgi:nucleotide-binding universal stress UspA family protein
MRSLSEILLPTDSSSQCVDVARYAAGVASHFSSKITLLHVLAPLNPAFAAFGSSAMLGEVLAHRKEETCNSLNLYLADKFRGIAVKRIISEGDPAEIITSYCASERVGLVMMPTRGCTAFRRFFLGSVTAKVLHDVNCPVWTSSHVTDRRPAVSVIPKVMVCAIDRTPDGELILKWAADLAAHLQARLIVANAIPSLEFYLKTHFLEADRRRSLIGDARAKILRMLQGSRMPGAEVRVEGGSVPKVVQSAVEDSRADLLIIGRASNGGRGRLRTHSYALIRESVCPVISI